MEKQVVIIVAAGTVQEVYNPSNVNVVMMDYDEPRLYIYRPSKRECPEKEFEDFEEAAEAMLREEKREKIEQKRSS